MKTCRVCGVAKSTEKPCQFYASQASPDGFRNACIECVRKRNLARYYERKRQREFDQKAAQP